MESPGRGADGWGDTPSSPRTPGWHNYKENTPMLSTQWDFVASYVRARFGDTEKGASLVEYALLVALIAVVCIAAVTFLGTSADEKFDKVGSSIND